MQGHEPWRATESIFSSLPIKHKAALTGKKRSKISPALLCSFLLSYRELKYWDSSII